jgi:hypothetical protein
VNTSSLKTFAPAAVMARKSAQRVQLAAGESLPVTEPQPQPERVAAAEPLTLTLGEGMRRAFEPLHGMYATETCRVLESHRLVARGIVAKALQRKPLQGLAFFDRDGGI